MSLSYEVTNWENGKTVLKAEHLRKIEKGITDIIAENDAIYKDEDTRKSNEKQRQEEHSRKMNEASEVVSNIQKDYDSLQKIIIDENASANLQNQINQTNSQLEHKVNISSLDTKVWSMSNMGQDVKEAMTGGSVAVVEKDTILTENIVDKQVTRGKTTFYSISKEGNLISNEMNVYEYGYLYTSDGSKIYCDHLTCKLTLEDIDFINIPLKFNMTSHITFWDENSSFISGYIQGSLDNGISTEKLKNIPSNAKYVLFGYYSSRKYSSVIAKDSNYSQELETKYVDDSLVVTQENLDKNIKFSKDVLEEITIYPYGNLFDKTKLLKNKYYDTSGTLIGSQGNHTFECEIDVLKSYRFNFTSHITFWDENSSFISGYIQGSLDNGISTEKLKNIPSNAKYVRMLVYDSRVDNAVFSLDEVYRKDLKCVYYIPNFIASDENLNNKQNDNPLYGKKAIFFGDSWCAGNTSSPGGWASIIKSNNPSMTVINCGKHGADWGQFYSYWFNNTDNYNSLDNDADYVIIEAYTNGLYTDVSNLVSKPLGDIDSYTYYNSIPEIDKALGETYARDLERCLFSVVNRWNGKKIGLIFPYKSVAHLAENNAFRVFRDTVIKCANKYNIPIFDNFNGSNIQCWKQEYIDKYFFQSDGTHLNALGYSIITPPIENWMKTL